MSGHWLSRMHLNPGPLSGITLGKWLRVLGRHRFRVYPRYWGRAVAITACAMVNTLLRPIEELRFRKRWEAVEVPPPLAVLGLARQGTTFLHQLLTTDERFGYLNWVQSRCPWIFLTSEGIIRILSRPFVGQKRLQDDVTIHAGSPEEEENYLCSMAFLSQWGSRYFQEDPSYYQLRFVDTFTAPQATEWKQTLDLMLRKLTLCHGKPLVLKSPINSVRLPFLLDVAPGMRFVGIVRHPAETMRSFLHLRRLGREHLALQGPETIEPEREVRAYCQLMNIYYSQRDRLLPERFIEISYDGLVAAPVPVLRRVYEHLGLPDFETFRPRLERRLAQLKDYRRNTHQELDAPLLDIIRAECPRWFEVWEETRARDLSAMAGG